MNKKRAIRFFLLGEIMLFALFYYYGAHGLKAVYALRAENSQVEQEADLLKQEIVRLEQEVERWKTDPFYKEKLAREHLQMARKDEEIYLIK